MTGPDDPVAETDPVPVIVRTVGDDHVLVLGPAGILGEWGTQEQALAPGLVDVVKGLAMAAPAFQGMVADLGGGLVRLTPEARALLANHGPSMTDGGGVMGVVRGADGKFQGLLSFQEASHLASVAANLPTMVASLALHAQLAVIERKLDAIQGDVATIIRDGRIEKLAEARAVLEIVGDVYSDVTASGLLTNDDWDRVGPLELPIKTLHLETKAQLNDLAQDLASPEVGFGRRVVIAGRAIRNDRLRFWFEAHIIADIALTRWETLRLERLIRKDDPRLAAEIVEVQESLVERRQFTEDFARCLAAYVSRAGKIEGALDRLRFIKRARLESLVLELEQVLEAHRLWVPASLPVSAPAAALPEGADAGFDWDAPVGQVRQHALTPLHRAGDAAGHAAVVVRRRSGDVLRSARERIRPTDPDEN